MEEEEKEKIYEELMYAISVIVEKVRLISEENVKEGTAAFSIYEIVTKAFPTKITSVGVLEAAKQLVWNEGELR